MKASSATSLETVVDSAAPPRPRRIPCRQSSLMCRVVGVTMRQDTSARLQVSCLCAVLLLDLFIGTRTRVTLCVTEHVAARSAKWMH